MESARNTEVAARLEGISRNARLAALASFVVLYAVLVAAGYALKEDLLHLTIIWPAAGLLLVALYFTPYGSWPLLIVAQLAVEIGVGYAETRGYERGFSPLFPFANLADGLVGALILRRAIPDAAAPRLRHVVAFVLSSAAGAAAGAVIGALAAVRILSGESYAHEWHLWWAANWLGSLTVAPVIITWGVRMFLPEHLAQTKRLLEVFVLGALVLAFTVWTFGEQATELQPPVQTPYLLLVILTVSAFRLPRRWATLLCALMVIVATAFAAHRLGPFGLSDSPFERVLQTQLFLATATIYAFGLATVLLEKQGLVGALTTTNNRYRNFVRHSSEAVWRVELHEPLSLELPIPEQVEWLKTHAFIAECSATFEALDTGFDASVKPDTTQRAELPWPGILTDSLYRVASQGYSIRDMPFTLRKRGAVEHWLASFDGIIENGKLLRIWGVARNVTDLVRSNERLRLDQQRLRDFANQLSQAEERARRATAVDLHDGIGQLMTAAAHSLEVAARQTGGSVAKLLENSLQMLRQIHTTTRDVIADLSPPGLYDLGLEPALQWLAIRFRSQHGLQVIVDVKLQERTLDLDTRILVFKIIRELLQNVVKHAQVDRAEVRVRGEGNLLSVEVTDHGVGFEWQYELFETTSRGFGLWSIGDRVREAGGTIDIETSPGAGCRVRLSFPLRARADSQVA